ncbi:MAG: zf-TFIIB domain-containing protein [Planctomycetaceae bacterium]
MVTQATIAISCQKCGGVSNVVAGQSYYRCQFCTSLVQPVEISADRILPTGQTLESCCPCCDISLQSGMMEGRNVLFCGDCFGLLLRNVDFGAIVSERVSRRVGVEPAEPRPIDPVAYERRVSCPSCKTKMDVHPYYGPGNVVVDTCCECGLIWLDHGEVTRVEQASGVRQTPWSQRSDVTPIPGSTEPTAQDRSFFGLPQRNPAAEFLADLFFGP